MGLPIPVPTVTPGPEYAENEAQCFIIIDAHDHTTGQGVQIPTAGININAALPMNNNILSDAASVNLYPQSLTPNNGSIYRNSNDLWFVDGAGNNVRITQNGSVAVSGAIGFTGLPSGSAGASYVTVDKSFVFQSATNTPGNVDAGSVIVRPVLPNSKGITISAPAALAADYSLQLPSSLPLATSVLEVSPAGVVSCVNVSSVQSPVGSMIMFAGSVSPVGWLLCDGSEISQIGYPDLFAVIGATFNTGGEAPGNFRVPDLRRRVAVGAGGTGSATLGNAVGNSGGAESVTLSVNEMPSHDHGGTTGSTTLNYGSVTNYGFGGATALSGTQTTSHSHTISSQGGGQAHNNIQPSLVVNYIIKY